METVATLISSAVLAFTFISIFWIRRRAGAINGINGIYAIVIFAFALWQWYYYSAGMIVDEYAIIISLFTLLVSAVHSICQTQKQICIIYDRRQDLKRRAIFDAVAKHQ